MRNAGTQYELNLRTPSAQRRNPDHLLKAGELLDATTGKLQVVAYEHGLVQSADIPGVKQRLCAVNDLALSGREDGEPAPHVLQPSECTR